MNLFLLLENLCEDPSLFAIVKPELSFTLVLIYCDFVDKLPHEEGKI